MCTKYSIPDDELKLIASGGEPSSDAFIPRVRSKLESKRAAQTPQGSAMKKRKTAAGHSRRPSSDIQDDSEGSEYHESLSDDDEHLPQKKNAYEATSTRPDKLNGFGQRLDRSGRMSGPIFHGVGGGSIALPDEDVLPSEATSAETEQQQNPANALLNNDLKISYVESDDDEI